MNDTNQAVALLRQTLPETLRTTPHLVLTYSGQLDGIAFCPRQTHDHGEQYTCGSCEVIGIYDPQLAALIVALLRAAGPLAAHLNAVDAWDHHPEQDNPDAPWSCAACGELGRQPNRCPAFSAADITRAINTAVAQ